MASAAVLTTAGISSPLIFMGTTNVSPTDPPSAQQTINSHNCLDLGDSWDNSCCDVEGDGGMGGGWPVLQLGAEQWPSCPALRLLNSV